MRYRIRSVIFSLLAGPIILISSCRQKEQPQASLIFSKTLKDFPSASAIEYDGNGRLYVFGDDAPYLLVLDTGYNKLDEVLYSIDSSFRIKKSEKADIESATLLNYNNEKHLYALGSFSGEERRRLYYFPLSDIHTYLSIDFTSFAEKLKAIPEPNIEGLAFVKSYLVMANRANKTHRTNKLIIEGHDLTEPRKTRPPHFIDLVLDHPNVLGLSGLYYVEEKDLLLFTASEEDTHSATGDGEIRDSYLGWIESFSKKMKETSLQPGQLIRLSGIHPVFSRQKIESVCAQRIFKDEMILHLVSDNDNGESGLFKLRLELP